MNALPPELSLRDQRRRLFFWLGVFVLPVFWSWFTLGRRFSADQRKLAFGWMGAYLLILACGHEWLVSRGHLIAVHGDLFFCWVFVGVGWWLCLKHCGTLLELAVLYLGFLSHIMKPLGGEGFMLSSWMLLALLVAHFLLARWERRLGQTEA